MKLLKNKLDALEAENQENFNQIVSEENRRDIQKMIQYLSSSPLPLFQIQIIKKDLIGMALEADKNNLTLDETLGIEPQKFCDDIIENAGKPARHEHFLKIIINVLQSFAFYYTFSYIFFWSMPEKFGIRLNEIILFVVWCGACGALTTFFRNKSSIRDSRLYQSLPFLFFILATVLLVGGLRISSFGSSYIITGTGWVLVLVVDLAALTATIIWNKYWKHTVKKMGV